MSDMEPKKPVQSEPHGTFPEKPNVVVDCFAAIIVIAFVACVLTGMLWPWTTEGVVQRVNYTPWNNSAIVTFDDGRTISLRGQPTRSLIPGKYYKITYTSLKYFYDVEEVEK